MADYLGDKTFEELNLKIQQDYQRPGPKTRDKTMQIDGKAGLWDFGADIAEKPFSLPCTLLEQDAAALQQSIRNLTAHLFDAYGKPKTMKLTFGDEPDVYYMVRFSGNQPISRIVGVGRFTLPLTAFDPYGYAESTAYDPNPVPGYDTGKQYDSGLMYDNSPSLEWQYKRQYYGCNNYSDMATPLILIMDGSVVNPRITNLITNETIHLPSMFNSTDRMLVDGGKYTIKKNGINTLSGYRGVFLWLQPGENSLLFEGGLPGVTVNFLWLHKFL